MQRAGQAVQQPQHHTGGIPSSTSSASPEALSVTGGTGAHIYGPITTRTPTRFPLEQPAPLCWHWEGEEGSALAEMAKKECSALLKKEEQHPLLALSARALELNKSDWEPAQTHVLVCTRVLSALACLSSREVPKPWQSQGSRAMLCTFSDIPVSLPGGDTSDLLQARLPNIY